MRRILIHMAILFALCFATVAAGERVAVGQDAPLAQGEDLLETWEAQWRGMSEERGALLKEMGSIEREYRAVIAQIDIIKRGGITNLERPELAQNLRRGKTIATKLDALQRDILRLDALLSTKGAQITTRLDSRRQSLERDLVLSPMTQHPGIVAKLNALSAKRATYAAPVAVTRAKDYRAIFEESNGLSDPDDMLALADELQDAEGEVRAKLETVQTQISELKRRQRLIRRARAFDREERFFEEGDRSRALAVTLQASRQEGGRAAADSPVSEGAESAAPTSAPPQAESEGDDAALGEEFESGANGLSSPSPGEPEMDSADPISNEAPSRDGSVGGFQDNPASPSLSSGGGSDPFAPTSETLIITQADPNVSTGDVEVAEGALDGKIVDLERDRKDLEEQARELKRRAARLRDRASRAE